MSKENKTKPSTTSKSPSGGLVFAKINYILMGIGLLVLVIGFLLMSGGGSQDPNQFDEGIFSFRRITLAPIVVMIGFVIEGFAIMYRKKVKTQDPS